MSTGDLTAGYPVHRVIKWHRWRNQHGAWFTDYATACGRVDTTTARLGLAGSAWAKELCRECFPQGVHGHYADAEEVSSRLVGGEESRGRRPFTVPGPVGATQHDAQDTGQQPHRGREGRRSLGETLRRSRYCGMPALVWYARVWKVRGADLVVGYWLDSLDHRGARMIWAVSEIDPVSETRIVTFGCDDTEVVHATVEYDVVDPNSQVAPDGSAL